LTIYPHEAVFTLRRRVFASSGIWFADDEIEWKKGSDADDQSIDP
jgi:hypothetical protein